MRYPINKPVKWAIILAITAALITVVVAVVLAQLDRGPRQPIPFSHKIHVESKMINCFFCHQYATVSSNPGIPPVEKCWLCHKVITSNFPPIAKIRWYYRRNEPIPWVRVNRVPDFTYFSHQPHLARGFDCGRCHGNVTEMDRIQPVQEFTMGFCVNCHEQNGASVDCYVCHR